MTNPRDTRMEETSRRQRRMETSCEGRPGRRRGCRAMDGWVEQLKCDTRLSSKP